MAKAKAKKSAAQKRNASIALPKVRKRQNKPSAPDSKRRKPDHLKKYQWKPGQSGNPTGRKKGYIPLGPMLRRTLSEIDPSTQKTKAAALVEMIITHAHGGDPQFAKLIFDRNDGKVPEASAQQLFDTAYGSFINDFVTIVEEVVKSKKSKERLFTALGISDSETASHSPNVDEKLDAEAVDPSKNGTPITKQRAIDFYTEIAGNAMHPMPLRLKAQERLDLLLGHVPEKGDTEMGDEERAETIRKLIADIDSVGGAPPEEDDEVEEFEDDGASKRER